jgi:DNA-damage-inducible protein J
MTTLRIDLDKDMKVSADELFTALGFDTATAVKIFIAAAIDCGGMPFRVKRTFERYKERIPNAELLEAIEDARLGRNLHGPFKTVDEAMEWLMDDEALDEEDD